MTKPLDIMMVGRRDDFVPMVANNWLMSGERGAPLRVQRQVYMTYEHAHLEKYWKDPTVLWLFACNPQDTNYCYGWCCGLHTDVGPVLHFVYVRRSMRDSRALQLGVAESLLRTFIGTPLPVARVTHTRTTPAFENMLAKNDTVRDLAGDWLYNPWLGYEEFLPCRSR